MMVVFRHILFYVSFDVLDLYYSKFYFVLVSPVLYIKGNSGVKAITKGKQTVNDGIENEVMRNGLGEVCNTDIKVRILEDDIVLRLSKTPIIFTDV